MNKTFTLIWSAARSAFIVAHEHAKSHGKPSSTSSSVATAAVLLGLLGSGGHALAGTPVAPPVNALPTGGQVAAGAASITQNANRMDINQSTQKAVLNWQSFNIGADAQVNFAQPNASAVALNRVLASDPSAIYGKLNANGQVFLLNPNGVLFGAGARVDVGGLVASTMSLGDADFLAGNYKFSGGSGSVVNQGNLTAAQGGYIALLSPEVRNEGVISASLGTVLLGGAEAVTLSHDSTGLQYAVDKGAVQALVDNKGLVQADGGQVILSARAANTLASAVINNSGTIEAKGLVAKGGRIVLEADSITLASGSTLDASGATGGGTVLVGGGWQGSGDLYQATTVTMEQGAKIDVSATRSGAGGTAVLWSDIHKADSVTNVDGEILAKGGSESGDGGNVETSGHKLSIADSARVNTSSTGGGKSGLWLLDPYDFTIGTGGDITGANLQTSLGLGNVSITTNAGSVTVTGAAAGSGTSTGSGNIIINDAFGWSANTLTLTADRYILVNNVVTVSGTGALTAGANNGGYTNSASDNTGYLKMKQTRSGTTGPDAFTGKIDWTSSGALKVNGPTYTKVSTQAELEAISGATKYFLANDIALTGTWTPLTLATPFTGVLDGLGHTISGLNTATAPTPYVGLFAKTGDVTLQNLGILNSNITGAEAVGALIGQAAGTTKLFNVFTSANTTVGYYNDGNRSQRGQSIGGLVGGVVSPSGFLAFFDSYNAAAVKTLDSSVMQTANPASLSIQYAGGILGGMFSVSSYMIKNVANYGTVIGGKEADKTDPAALGVGIGGLFGYFIAASNTAESTIANSRNYGAIYGQDGVGGIIGNGGAQENSTNLTLQDLRNEGSISGRTSVGGIAGILNWNNSVGPNILTLTRLGNSGAISGSQAGTYVGGLIGNLQNLSSPTYRYVTGSVLLNSGTVTGGQYVGGIFGRAQAYFDNEAKIVLSDVQNTGAVNALAITNGYAGGVIGWANWVGTGSLWNQIVNLGQITSATTGTQYVGNIAGLLETTSIPTAGSNLGNSYGLSGAVANNNMYGTNKRSSTVTQNVTAADSTTEYATKTSTQLQDTLANLNLSTTYWGGGSGSLPYLLGYTVPLTINFTSGLTSVYGSAPSGSIASGFTVSGCTNCITLSYGSFLTNTTNAGSYSYASNPTLLSLGYSSGSAADYAINWGANSSFVVTQKPLTITAPQVTRTYDGTTSATGTSTVGALAANGDSVFTAPTLTFDTKNFGIGNKTVTPSAIVIKNGATDVTANYSFTYSPNTTSTINKLALTVTAPDLTKTYDGGLTASGTATYSSALGTGDSITTNPTLAFLDRNVGTDTKTVRASGLVINDGNSGNNYTVSYTDNTTSTISPLALTVTAPSVTKTYDGGLSAIGSATYSSARGSGASAFGASDSITTNASIAFTDKNAGTANKTVAASGLVISDGNSGSNYTVSYASNTTSTINQATLTVTGSKTYDGTTNLLNYLTLGGFVGSETVGYSAATASSSHVATANKYVSGITLTDGTDGNGGLAANYQIPASYGAGTNAIIISTATLTPTLTNTGVTKTYDGLLTSSMTPTWSFSGLVSGDTAATIGYTGRNYNTKDVATANTVTVSGLSISGITGSNSSAASDYVLDAASKTVGGTVTRKDVSITSINIADKVYDGTTTAYSVQSTALSGVVAADSANVNISGTLGAFSSKDVGTYSVSVTGVNLTGSESNNYNLTGGTTATDASVAITKKTVTLSASKTYDGTNSLNGFVTLGTGVAVGGVTETLTYTGATTNNVHVATGGKYINAITLANATDSSGGLAEVAPLV